MNTLPNVDKATAEPADNDDAAICLSSQTNRTFSKSLSTVSVSTVGCPASELLSNMDSQLCLLALEHLLLLVASQVICIIRSPELEPRWKTIVRRDISNELVIFHEFVRRKVIVNYKENRSPWLRRKHGLFKVKYLDPARHSSSPSSSARNPDPVRRVSTAANELRVNVVRRQHLQQQLRSPPPNTFDMSVDISTISAMLSPTEARDSRKRLYPAEQVGAAFVADELNAIEQQFSRRPRSTAFASCRRFSWWRRTTCSSCRSSST